MSKLIEELSTIPEWNSLGNQLRVKFSEMDSEDLDNLNKDRLYDIISEKYFPDACELVARLVYEKIKEEWRKEGKDEFDRLIKLLKGAK